MLILKEPIEFSSLSILKRTNCCGDRYNNVCLVIDEDNDNQICTNTDSGFDNQKSGTIFWNIGSQGIYLKIFLFLSNV